MISAKKYSWFCGQESNLCVQLLMRAPKNGAFLVRISSTKKYYVLLVVTREKDQQPMDHFRIFLKQNKRYQLEDDTYEAASLPELVEHLMQCDQHGLPLLKYTPRDIVTAEKAMKRCSTAQRWHIDFNELEFVGPLGQGSFGIVSRARFRGIDVAVKTMIDGMMSEDLFIKEAHLMVDLQHPHVVRLVGVCTRERPLFIVTEYMSHGSLLTYLIRHKPQLMSNVKALRSICTQVAKGMAYLESKRFVHRDLASRNCLVGSNGAVKVSDFGLSRYMNNTYYRGAAESLIPAYTIPPEVLKERLFSTKSDVYSFGLLMWEVFMGGVGPFSHLDAKTAQDRVSKGFILWKPKGCPEMDYLIMQHCWKYEPKQRPTFAALENQLEKLVNVS